MEDALLLTRINDEAVNERRERAVATEIVGNTHLVIYTLSVNYENR